MKSNNGTNRILHHNIAAQTLTFPDVGKNVKDDSSDDITCVFPAVWCPCFTVAKPLFMHLSITFSNQRFSNCSPTINDGFVKLTSDSFCENRALKMNIQFRCHLCYSGSVIFRNNPQCTMISFCWSSPTVLLRWCCLPIILVCRHNLRNCRSWYT
jgi:hypothetical protein